MKKASDLLKLTPTELKRMPKKEVHKGYLIIMAKVLMDFYIEASNKEPSIETVKDLQEFIAKWLSKHIKQPHKDWNPGDCGK
jgi:hypothetical protein